MLDIFLKLIYNLLDTCVIGQQKSTWIIRYRSIHWFCV